MNEKKHIKTGWIIFWLILFFPVGLILTWTKTAWTKRTKWIVTGAVCLLLFIGAIGNSQSTKSPSTDSQSQPTPAVTQQMKNDYISFYKQYMTIANKSDKTNNKVLDDITAISNGTSSMTTADLYLEASDAHDTQESLKSDELNLQVPDSLGDYKDKLEQASTNLYSLLGARSTTMKSMADYLNGGDLSKIKDVRNSTQEQQSEMLSAVASLVEVGMKLGIDTTKIQVNQ